MRKLRDADGSVVKMGMEGRRILVLGMGRSGQATARFLLARGARVVGVDQQAEALKSQPELVQLQSRGLQLLGEEEPCDPADFSLVVASPGVPPSQRLYHQASTLGVPLIGDTELAFRFLRRPVIGITGSNGKTTVTLLVTHLLQAAGRRAKAVGNIGTPLIAEVDQEPSDEILVAELSSFQLETAASPALSCAALLNITPNHLDRHRDFAAYAEAKSRIATCLKPGAPLYVHDSISREFAVPYRSYGYRPGGFLWCDGQAVRRGDSLEYYLPVEYRNTVSHDVENQIAAYALCQAWGLAADRFLAALQTFKKPAHRLEFVCERAGVEYVNDSKATSVDAVIKAVAAMRGKVILIAGGVDKGGSYAPWIEACKHKVRAICVIGQAAHTIAQTLAPHYPVIFCESLEDAVEQAKQLAEPGNTVLLSPGCSSFDQFKNYAERGETFRKAVMS